MASTVREERAGLARVPECSGDRGSGPSWAEGAPPGRLAGIKSCGGPRLVNSRSVKPSSSARRASARAMSSSR
eukprot:4743254-Pleurochrysis_carterae.AAC.1